MIQASVKSPIVAVGPMEDLEAFVHVLVACLPVFGAIASRSLTATLLSTAFVLAALFAGEDEAYQGMALWALAWLGAYLPARAQERRVREESRRWRRIPSGHWHHWQRNLPGF